MVSLGVEDGEVYLGGVAVARRRVASRRVAQEQVKGSREMRRERWRAARLFFPALPALG